MHPSPISVTQKRLSRATLLAGSKKMQVSNSSRPFVASEFFGFEAFKTQTLTVRRVHPVLLKLDLFMFYYKCRTILDSVPVIK